MPSSVRCEFAVEEAKGCRYCLVGKLCYMYGPCHSFNVTAAPPFPLHRICIFVSAFCILSYLVCSCQQDFPLDWV